MRKSPSWYGISRVSWIATTYFSTYPTHSPSSNHPPPPPPHDIDFFGNPFNFTSINKTEGLGKGCLRFPETANHCFLRLTSHLMVASWSVCACSRAVNYPRFKLKPFVLCLPRSCSRTNCLNSLFTVQCCLHQRANSNVTM